MRMVIVENLPVAVFVGLPMRLRIGES
jgi:hypothetical protein